MGIACGTQGRAYKCTQHLVGETEGKRLLAKLRHRWIENTVVLGWDRRRALVNTALNIWHPQQGWDYLMS